MARPKKMEYKGYHSGGFPTNLAEFCDNELKLGYEFVPPVYNLGGNEWYLLFRRVEPPLNGKVVIKNQ